MSTHSIVGKVKQLRGQVTAEQAKRDNDVQGLFNGKREELAGMAQKNYGLVKEKAQGVVDTLSHKTDIARQSLEHQLSGYNTKLENAADKLPGDVNQVATRYPWVTIMAFLTLGLVVGMWLKPCFKK